MNLFKQFFVLLVAIVSSVSANAQKIETTINYVTAVPGISDNTILYDAPGKLKIEDFKGKPENDNVAVAITTSGFTFKAGFRKAEGKSSLIIGVYCTFNKETSWMKERGKNDYILLHEQHHFDISYISTLLFIKALKKIKFKQEGYMDQIKDVYYAAIKQMEALQQQYDSETNNGILKDRQAAWNKKIDDQVTVLAAEQP